MTDAVPWPRRVALVSDHYPADGQAGGIATYTQRVARWLAGSGRDVHVVAGGGHHDLSDRSVSVHLVPEVGDADVIGARLLAEARRGGPFDLVETPEFKALGRVAVGRREVARRLAVRLHGAETLLGHHPDIWARGEDPERGLTLAADVVTAPSRAAVEMTDVAWGTSLREHTVVVGNPAPDWVRPRAPAPTFDVLVMGRLEPRKGIALLAQLFRQFPRRLTVHVAGADHAWEDGRSGLEILRSSGADIRHLGAVDPPTLADQLAHCGLVLLPSRRETFGLTLLEAMAARAPVIASDIPPFRELAAGSGPLLLPPDDEALWVPAVADILDHPAAAAERARTAQRRGGGWRVDVIGPALVDAWSRLNPPSGRASAARAGSRVRAASGSLEAAHQPAAAHTHVARG